MRESCDICRFWRGETVHGLGANMIGACRRYPPKPASGGSGISPMTQHDDWCGEFQAVPAPEPPPLPLLPEAFHDSRIAKDWVVDPNVLGSGEEAQNPGKFPGHRGFLKLGVRARKCLARLGIRTVGEIIQHTSEDLLSTKHTGVSTLWEIQDALAACDLYLRDHPRNHWTRGWKNGQPPTQGEA